MKLPPPGLLCAICVISDTDLAWVVPEGGDVDLALLTAAIQLASVFICPPSHTFPDSRSACEGPSASYQVHSLGSSLSSFSKGGPDSLG